MLWKCGSIEECSKFHPSITRKHQSLGHVVEAATLQNLLTFQTWKEKGKEWGREEYQGAHRSERCGNPGIYKDAPGGIRWSRKERTSDATSSADIPRGSATCNALFYKEILIVHAKSAWAITSRRQSLSQMQWNVSFDSFFSSQTVTQPIIFPLCALFSLRLLQSLSDVPTPYSLWYDCSIKVACLFPVSLMMDGGVFFLLYSGWLLWLPIIHLSETTSQFHWSFPSHIDWQSTSPRFTGI